MKTDQQPEAMNTAVFPQIVTDAVSKLKNRLQRQYELAYPDLSDLIRIVLDEEETRAWELSFPHLLLPDLVHAHIEKLNLQPTATRHDDLPEPYRFPEIDNHQPAFALCG